MSTEAFQAGVAALKSGNKALAREHLMKVVEQDETNEQAWLYLAGALEDPDEIRISLENALHINPQSNRAKQGLEWLRKQHPAVFAEPTPALPEATPPAYTGATLALADLPLSDKPLPGQPIQQTPFPATQPLGQAPLPATQPLGNGPSPATQQLAPPALGEVPDVLPCPRCGAPTRYVDQRCRQCSMNLTIKADRQGQSKAPVTIAGLMTFLPALLALVSAIAIFIIAGLGWSDYKKDLVAGMPEDRRAAFLEANEAKIDRDFDQDYMPFFNMGAASFLVGFIGIIVSVALFKRSKFGLIGSLIYNLLFLAVWGFLALAFIIQGPFIDAMLDGFATSAKQSEQPQIIDPDSIVSFVQTLISAIYFTAGYYLITVIMIIVAWRSISRKTVRFVPQFEELADANGHFNRGVVYQKRGMWYLSMLEWERAVKLNPRDSTYRHALGLIYEQMKRPADALQQFEQALSEDPNNLRIGQDRDRLVQTLRA